MIDPAQIPPEVVEAFIKIPPEARIAAVKAFAAAQSNDKKLKDCLDAAIAAALAAWPGAKHSHVVTDPQILPPSILILPLQEPRT
jgi:hypothetical protein